MGCQIEVIIKHNGINVECICTVVREQNYMVLSTSSLIMYPFCKSSSVWY